MKIMTTDPIRIAFEQQHPHLPNARHESGCYEHHVTDDEWKKFYAAWRAAETAAFEAKFPENSLCVDGIWGWLERAKLAAARERELVEALKTILASASPHPMEHGAMYEAWQKGKAALAKSKESHQP